MQFGQYIYKYYLTNIITPGARTWVLLLFLVFGIVFFCGLFSSCVLCAKCCQFLWIVQSWFPRFSLTFIYMYFWGSVGKTWYPFEIPLSFWRTSPLYALWRISQFSVVFVAFGHNMSTVVIKTNSKTK